MGALVTVVPMRWLTGGGLGGNSSLARSCSLLGGNVVGSNAWTFTVTKHFFGEELAQDRV